MKKSLVISYQSYDSMEELSQIDKVRFEKLEQNLKSAYAPYSGFKVAAMVVLEDETEWVGTNQENIAYPSGLCAERVALFYVGSQFPKSSIKKMYITALGDLVNDQMPIMPCGACRQVMMETRSRQLTDFSIYLKGQGGGVMVFDRIEDLLPFSFRRIV